MSEGRYVHVKFPAGLGLRIKSVAVNEEEGYRNITEFVVDAIRTKLQLIQQQQTWGRKHKNSE